MTVTEARQLVAQQIEKQKITTAKSIHSETQIPYVMIYAAIKHFTDGSGIEVELKDDTKNYKLLDAKKLRALVSGEAPKKNSKQEEKEGDITATPTMKKYANVPTRDTSKYIFMKEKRGKGRTVLAVIQHHLATKKVTLEKLKTTFPDELVQKWGVTASANSAAKHDRQRYFTGEHDILVTSDKKRLAVTNQWTASRFDAFCKVAKGLGYKIQKAE
jgi:hypothetical protein